MGDECVFDNTKIDGFKCICKEGFYGKRCEYDIIKLKMYFNIKFKKQNPCGKFGRMMIKHDLSVECFCANVFTGHLCEKSFSL